MKESELRAHAICSICKKKIGASGLPMFYRLKIERFGVKLDAMRRQDGLTALLNGHARLAMVMGTDEDMAIPAMDPLTLVICEACAGEPTQYWVPRLAGYESTVEKV